MSGLGKLKFKCSFIHLKNTFLIFVTQAKNVVTLSVDDIFAQPGIGVPGVSSTDTKHGLFIGGHPRPERLTALAVIFCIIRI